MSDRMTVAALVEVLEQNIAHHMDHSMFDVNQLSTTELLASHVKSTLTDLVGTPTLLKTNDGTQQEFLFPADFEVTSNPLSGSVKVDMFFCVPSVEKLE